MTELPQIIHLISVDTPPEKVVSKAWSNDKIIIPATAKELRSINGRLMCLLGARNKTLIRNPDETTPAFVPITGIKFRDKK